MSQLRFVGVELLCTEYGQRQAKQASKLQQTGLIALQVDGGEGAEVLQLKTMTSKAGLDQSKHYASGATALAAEPGHQRRPRLIKLDQVRRCYGGTARR